MNRSGLAVLLVCPLPVLAHSGHALVHDALAHGWWIALFLLAGLSMRKLRG